MNTIKKKIMIILGVMVVLIGGIYSIDIPANAGENTVELKDIPLNQEYFPGEYFRRYVTVMYDTNQDGILSEEERISVKKMSLTVRKTLKAIGEPVRVGDRPELDITGIEHFSELEIVRMQNWHLTGEGLEGLKNLKKLDMNCCGLDEYTQLNIPSLEILKFRENEASLSCVSTVGFPELKKLYLEAYQEGKILSLDVSKNKKLEKMVCNLPQLSKIDITNNKKLEILDLALTEIEGIDLTNNRALIKCHVASKIMSEVDLSKNVNIVDLNIEGGKIKEIDVSNLRKVERMYICGTLIKELSLENNRNLKRLGCFMNKMEKIDLSHNKKLNWLDCSNNKLKEVDISHLKNLEYLSCEKNQITEIDIRNNKKLTALFAHDCKVKKLDVSMMPKKSTLQMWNNEMQELKISKWMLVFRYDDKRPILYSWLYDYTDGNNIQTLDIGKITSMNQIERKGLERWVLQKIKILKVSQRMAAKDKKYIKKLAKKYKVTVQYV